MGVGVVWLEEVHKRYKVAPVMKDVRGEGAVGGGRLEEELKRCIR